MTSLNVPNTVIHTCKIHADLLPMNKQHYDTGSVNYLFDISTTSGIILIGSLIYADILLALALAKFEGHKFSSVNISLKDV